MCWICKQFRLHHEQVSISPHLNVGRKTSTDIIIVPQNNIPEFSFLVPNPQLCQRSAERYKLGSDGTIWGTERRHIKGLRDIRHQKREDAVTRQPLRSLVNVRTIRTQGAAVTPPMKFRAPSATSASNNSISALYTLSGVRRLIC